MLALPNSWFSANIGSVDDCGRSLLLRKCIDLCGTFPSALISRSMEVNFCFMPRQ
uniref:Uncharacterized protein n=1 Tax=Arundo donax TaxID=35708 RepID=A0A0A9EGF7_ARUDO